MERQASAEQASIAPAGNLWDGRRTRAIVDLDLLAANVRALKKVAGGAELMTVVKGNAYGHGSVPVALTALESGATRIGVFTADEGAELRLEGIDAPVLVLGPFSSAEARTIVAHGLTPTVNSTHAGVILQRAALGRSIDFHTEIDTGLTRGGVRPFEAVDLLRQLARLPALRFQGLFTHFADAGEYGEPTAKSQLTLFRDTVSAVECAGFALAFKHAANSAATLHFPTAYFDMVRVGIGTYGYFPSARRTEPSLQPVLSLVSEVSRVTHVPVGTGVGYGHDFRCLRASTIALVAIGYADGLHRSLGNGRGTVLIRGTHVPIVGRVSMDQITVDATDLPSVETGDEVVLIGRQGERVQSADTLAIQGGTISYEVLTSLLPRVPRLYTRAGKLIGINLDGKYRSWNGSSARGAEASL